jgi:hypothetical protein
MLPPEKMRDGYLRVRARIAVPGVMEYQGADGSVVREYIPAEELHKTDSLKSLASVPTTLGHPEEDVNPDNVSTYGVGDVGERVQIIEDTGHVEIGMVLRRRDALQAVDEGVREVSPGYTCIIDPTPGVHPEFGRYDRIQRDRRYNHVAIVDEARGGPTVHLRADGFVQRTRLDATTPTPAASPSQESKMIPPTLLMLAALVGVSTSRKDMEGQHKDMDVDELAAEIAQVIRAREQKTEDMEEKLTDAEAEGSELETLKAENAALKKKVADMEAEETERKDAAEKVRIEKERAHLDELAKKIRFDSSAWKDDVDNAARKLDLARFAKLISSEDTPDESRLDGMLHAVSKSGSGANPWEGVRVDAKPPKATATTETTRVDSARNQDALADKPVDPFKANMRARQDERNATT